MDKRLERRKRERLDRKNSILGAARKVFFARGFMDATVDEIAEGCGLAKGTIYLYFRSKEDIFISLVGEGINILKKEIEKKASRNLRSDRLLEELVKAYYGFYKKHKNYFRVIFLSHPDRMFLSSVSEEVLRGSVDASKECLGIVSDVIKKGIDEGLFRKVDPWLTANVIWAMVNGVITFFDQDPVYRDEIVGTGLEKMVMESYRLALDGLRAKK